MALNRCCKSAVGDCQIFNLSGKSHDERVVGLRSHNPTQEISRCGLLLRQHTFHRVAGIQNQPEFQWKIVVTFELVEMADWRLII